MSREDTNLADNNVYCWRGGKSLFPFYPKEEFPDQEIKQLPGSEERGKQREEPELDAVEPQGTQDQTLERITLPPNRDGETCEESPGAGVQSA